jgi:hypothetical protein
MSHRTHRFSRGLRSIIENPLLTVDPFLTSPTAQSPRAILTETRTHGILKRQIWDSLFAALDDYEKRWQSFVTGSQTSRIKRFEGNFGVGIADWKLIRQASPLCSFEEPCKPNLYPATKQTNTDGCGAAKPQQQSTPIQRRKRRGEFEQKLTKEAKLRDLACERLLFRIRSSLDSPRDFSHRFSKRPQESGGALRVTMI